VFSALAQLSCFRWHWTGGSSDTWLDIIGSRDWHCGNYWTPEHTLTGAEGEKNDATLTRPADCSPCRL